MFEQRKKIEAEMALNLDEGIKAWEAETYFSQKRSISRLRIYGVGQTILSICLVAIMMMMVPLQKTDTVVLTVDKHTGLVNVESHLGQITLDDEEALTQSLIFRYVRDRETYDYADYQELINGVYKVSKGRAAKDLKALFEDDNKNSPANVLGRRGRVTVKIRSVVLQPNDRALINLIKTTQAVSGGPTNSRNYVVGLSYGFNRKGKMTLAERWINPVGFYVENYRIDEEAN